MEGFELIGGVILALIGIGLLFGLGIFGSILTGLAGFLVYKKLSKVAGGFLMLSLIGHIVLLFYA